MHIAVLKVAGVLGLVVLQLACTRDRQSSKSTAGADSMTFVRSDTIRGLENAWANAVAFSDWSRARGAPRLESFRVDTLFHAPPAAVDFASARGARRFRTVLSHGAAAGPNFADHYTIVSWGCGSPCVEWVILDAATGRVAYWTPEPAVSPPVFARWSRLLAEDPTGFNLDSAGHPIFGPMVYYREWIGNKLVLRDSLNAAAARIRD
jgi:hypothetical protein